MAKVKKTKAYKEYMKERRRLQSAYYRLTSQGYIFDDNPIPAIPQRITSRSVSSLHKMNADTLRRKSKYIVDITTGEQIRNTKSNNRAIKEAITNANKQLRQERALRREAREQQAQTADFYARNGYSYEEEPVSIDIVEAIRERIRNLPDVRGFKTKGHQYHQKDFTENKRVLESILDDTIQEQQDEEAYISYLESVEAQIMELLDIVANSSDEDSVNIHIARLLKLLQAPKSVLDFHQNALEELSDYIENSDDEITL